MELGWFKRDGIAFLPKKWPGWLILAGFLGYTVYMFIDIDSRSHSVSDTLINFAFNAFLLTILYEVLAWLISLKK